MFVLHHTRQGFIHVARTGGRYVESQCEHRPDFELILPRHRFRESLYPNYEWHMVIRDPVDRWISIYNLWRHTRADQESVMITHSLNCPSTVFLDPSAFVDWFCQRHIRYASHWTEQRRYWSAGVRVWSMIALDQLLVEYGNKSKGSPINQSIGKPVEITDEDRIRLKSHYKDDYSMFDIPCPLV